MKILFAGRAFEKLFPLFDRFFSEHDARIADFTNLQEALIDAEVLVTGPMKIDASLLKGARRLKLIHQWGAGLEMVDIDACSDAGVALCNVPSGGTGNAEGVGEIAILHILLLARRYDRALENLRRERLHSPQGVSLWNKRVCVVGLGNVGRSVVGRLSGFGAKVTGVNRSWRDDMDSLHLDSFYPLTKVLDALPGCRFVVMALGVGPGTSGIVDREFFGAMDPDSFLINVGRADLVRRDHLEEALDSGEIAGAGMDVFWDEPASREDPLLARSNVTLTPHIGGVTDEAVTGIARFIADNVSRFSRGERLLSMVNDAPGFPKNDAKEKT
ncbi:MAG: 2-hydroxyacid dehydrogenase [Synergistota bacterium]|nr:2-hydroxyacid dehydrogenase [Synergistota bacterium]